MKKKYVVWYATGESYGVRVISCVGSFNAAEMEVIDFLDANMDWDGELVWKKGTTEFGHTEFQFSVPNSEILVSVTRIK